VGALGRCVAEPQLVVGGYGANRAEAHQQAAVQCGVDEFAPLGIRTSARSSTPRAGTNTAFCFHAESAAVVQSRRGFKEDVDITPNTTIALRPATRRPHASSPCFGRATVKKRTFTLWRNRSSATNTAAGNDGDGAGGRSTCAGSAGQESRQGADAGAHDGTRKERCTHTCMCDRRRTSPVAGEWN
jgi:hypothetical protein